jgi:gliding motility-associated-like protein
VCKSDSSPVTVEVVDCEAFSAPNIFTPNGDGVNDIWFPSVEYETCFKCRIYNRWGALVTEFDRKLRGWDGTYRDSGGLVEDGTYYYIINYCDFTGTNGVHTGYIQVIH